MMRVVFHSILLLAGSFACAQPASTFNNKRVEVDSTGNYSFLVSGHFYGDGTNKSGYPANTLLANLDWINASDACMFICLGDLFMDIRNDIPNYQASFFDKLDIPLYNAVGNHDLSGNIYQDNFGLTSFSFRVGNDLHVILDSEMDGGDIKKEQLKMLDDIAADCENGLTDNVFIYAHRTIWKDSYTELNGLFTDNTQSVTTTNYKDEVLPIASKIAKHSNLYWFAGSLGNAPASFFYFKDEKNNITYIATAIRAMLRDAVLIVNVNNSNVSFETHSFTNQPVEPLTTYDVNYWKETSAEEPFNYRLIPLYIKNVFTSRYFWYGTAFAMCLVGVIWLIRRRRKRTT